MSDEVLREILMEMKRTSRELTTIRELASKAVNYIIDAEREVPERIRRFCNTMHDVHDIKYMYEDVGSTVPLHILRECERLDDRYRQILKELNAEGGAFNKIRREMAADPENRWDHTRLLEKPKENGP